MTKHIAATLLIKYIRFEKIILLAACHAAAPEGLEELIEDGSDQFNQAFENAGIDFNVDESDLAPDIEDIISSLARKNIYGFLVQAAHPTYYQPNNDLGHCFLRWLYTPQIDDAFIQTVVQWRDEIHSKAKQTPLR